MKIRIGFLDIETLTQIKSKIETLMQIDFKEMELTEKNIKEAIRIKKLVAEIGVLQFRLRGIDIKIVNSDGTELTKIN